MYRSDTRHGDEFTTCRVRIDRLSSGEPVGIAVGLYTDDGLYLSLSLEEAERLHRRLGELLEAGRALLPELEREREIAAWRAKPAPVQP